MTKMYVDEDSRYPVYGIFHPRIWAPERTVDIDPEFIARFEAAEKEFEECQLILAKLHQDQCRKD